MRSNRLIIAIICAFACPVALVAADEEASNLIGGDYSVSVTVRHQDGSLVRGEPFRLMKNLSGGVDLKVSEGVIPEDGVLRLEGLVGGEDSARYSLIIGERGLDAGTIMLSGAEKQRELEFILPPAPGDAAPDLTFTGLFSDTVEKLSDFRGQFVFLDFWASWCGPCQKPMAENQETMKRNAEDWKGKAVVVALSIDDTIKAAQDHVREQGWTDIRHFWASAGPPGWASDAVRTYAIMGIPTAFLIDPDGQIVWRGHPGSVNPETLIADSLESWNPDL